jgi:hypothetical protein
MRGSRTTAAVMSVPTRPGPTAFTVTPAAATSSAAARASPTTPAFATL